MVRSALSCWLPSSAWWKRRPRCWSRVERSGARETMKYVFWGLVGVIVLGVVVVGGGAYWLANVEVDFKDPQMVGKFTETFSKNCVATYEKQLTKAGTTPTAEQLVAAEAACKCARDPV